MRNVRGDSGSENLPGKHEESLDSKGSPIFWVSLDCQSLSLQYTTVET